MDWNRKDCLVQDTIDKINGILKELGIETYVISKNEHEGFWYSYNIGIKGLSGVFTNGKGVTREYAMASALAEMMERLQNDILLGQAFPEDGLSDSVEDTKLMEIYKEYWSEFFYDGIFEEWITFVQKHPFFSNLEEFENIYGTRKKSFPIGFISYICGSNGACAGNTREEALAQGLAEVFERFALKEIYFGNSEFLFSNIPLEKLGQLQSYKLLNRISENGYKVWVKDLTLGGRVPVLGLLVFDHKCSKYKFSVASDLDIDICIQRCITETFQGRDIRNTFKHDMCKVFCDTTISEKRWGISKDMEYMKSLISGEGKVPNKMLLEQDTQNDYLKPFLRDKADNKKCLKELNLLAEKMGWEIWVRDQSYLGFPAYRIYIKNVTEAFVLPKMDIVREIISVYALKDELKRINQKNNTELRDLYSLFKRVRNYPRYRGSKEGLLYFCGIICDRKLDQYDLWNEMQYKIGSDAGISVDELLGIKASRPKLSDKDCWENFIKKYKLFDLRGECSPVLEDVIYGLYSKTLSYPEDEDLAFPTCNNCDVCLLKEYCVKERVLNIKRNMRDRKMRS